MPPLLRSRSLHHQRTLPFLFVLLVSTVMLSSTLHTPPLAIAAGPVLDPTYAWQGLPLTRFMGNDQFNFFGTAVAHDGDTLAVVAPSERTIAIYTRPVGTSGPWALAAHATPTDTDGIASVVALAGDILAVGGTERVYLFERNQGGPNQWGQVARIDTPVTTSQMLFGSALALTATTLAIGAPWYYDDTLGPRSGAVFLYHRGPAGPADWGTPLRITSDDAAAWDSFGSALALDGATLAVGASQSEYYTTDPGAAYIFQQTGPGLWSQIARLTASDRASSDRFGKGLALDGDTLAVTASGVGTITVFARDQGGLNSWGTSAQIDAPDHALSAAIALDGDRLAVGAPHLTIGTADDQGAVFVYGRDGVQPSHWVEQTRIIADDGAADSFFGTTVALTGDEVLTGAHGTDGAGYQWSVGAVYLHRLALRPTLSEDTATLDEDTSLALAVLANDTSPLAAGTIDPASLCARLTLDRSLPGNPLHRGRTKGHHDENEPNDDLLRHARAAINRGPAMPGNLERRTAAGHPAGV